MPHPPSNHIFKILLLSIERILYLTLFITDVSVKPQDINETLFQCYGCGCSHRETMGSPELRVPSSQQAVMFLVRHS